MKVNERSEQLAGTCESQGPRWTAQVHGRSQSVRQFRHGDSLSLVKCVGNITGSSAGRSGGGAALRRSVAFARVSCSRAVSVPLSVEVCLWRATSMARDERKRATCMGVGGRDGVAPLASGNAVVCERGRRDDLHVLLT